MNFGSNNSNFNFKSIAVSFLLALTVGFTLPGLRDSFSFLPEGPVKVMGLALIVFLLLDILNLLKNKRLLFFTLLLFVLLVYRSIHRSDQDSHLLLVWISFAWLILLVAGISKKNGIIAFSFSLLLPLSFIILSAGLSTIFMTRSISHVGERISLTGMTRHYIYYSEVCIVALFIFLALFFVSKSTFLKVLFGLGTITAFLAGATSGSRGGALAIFVGSTFFMLCNIKSNNKKNVLYFIFLGVLVAFLAPWSNIIEALTGEDIYTGSTGLRWDAYVTAFNIFMEHPFIGIGWDKFREHANIASHSGWIQVFVELGLLGGLLEIIIWLYIFKTGFLSIRIAKAIGDYRTTVLVNSWMSMAVSFCFWQAIENYSFLLGTRIYYIFAAVIFAAYYRLREDMLISKANYIANRNSI